MHALATAEIQFVHQVEEKDQYLCSGKTGNSRLKIKPARPYTITSNPDRLEG